MRKVIGHATQEEIDSLNLIKTKIVCVKQALSIIPEGSEDDKIFYFQSMLDSYANYQWLEQDWWQSVAKRLDVDIRENINIDFLTGEYFVNG